MTLAEYVEASIYVVGIIAILAGMVVWIRS